MRYTDERLEAQVKSALNAWAAEGSLPNEKLDALLLPVRHHRRMRSRLVALAAVAASILLLMTFPQVRVWAAEAAAKLPIIGDFIRRVSVDDPMWAWAQEHDAFRGHRRGVYHAPAPSAGRSDPDNGDLYRRGRRAADRVARTVESWRRAPGRRPAV